MKTIEEIMKGYTSGEVSLEETNAALKEANAGYQMNPGKNVLTEQEIAETRLGYDPSGTNGWGVLFTGTGSPDKVEIRNGKLVGTNIGIMHGEVFVSDHKYYVDGDTLIDEKPTEAPWWAPMHTFVGAVSWKDELPCYTPEREMIYNRPNHKNQNVVKGSLRYMYDENGNCKYQPKSMREYDEDHGRV